MLRDIVATKLERFTEFYTGINSIKIASMVFQQFVCQTGTEFMNS